LFGKKEAIKKLESSFCGRYVQWRIFLKTSLKLTS